MPVDTAAKRYSAIGIISPWRGSHIVPSALFTQGERQASAFLYSGILASSVVPVIPVRPPVVPPPVITPGTPTSQIVTQGNITGLQIPHISVPVIDAATQTMSEPWFNYFSQKEHLDQATTMADVPSPIRAGLASEASDIVVNAILNRLKAIESRGMSAETERRRPRQWSTFEPIADTRANRANYLPAAYPSALFAETDTGSSLVYRSDGVNWIYFSGIYSNTLANILTGLGTSDTNLLFEVTDYDHVLEWTGAAWTWGPGEVGSGFYAMFEAAPSSAGASAWQICDGSTVARLNADGTTTNVTVPNLGTAAYLKGGTSSTAVAAASGLTTSVSAGTPSGTNSAPVFTGTSAATGGPSATTTVDNDLVVSTVAVGSGTHTHNVTATGNVSAPTFTGNALAGHDHGPNTIELRNKQATLYYRR